MDIDISKLTDDIVSAWAGFLAHRHDSSTDSQSTDWRYLLGKYHALRDVYREIGGDNNTLNDLLDAVETDGAR